MENIVISVSDVTAKKWQNTPPNIKTWLEKSFANQINEIAEKSDEVDFEKLLDKTRAIAASNGLTEEILEKLLNED